MKLSATTIKKIQKAAWSVQQAQAFFTDAYQSALCDGLGKDWKNTWEEHEDLPGVLGDIESQIKTACLEAGMTLTIFNRYRTAARKLCFHDVPFKFGVSFSVSEIKKAEALAESYNTGTREQKIERAYKEIRQLRQMSSAKRRLAKTMTILPVPEDGQSKAEYSALLLAELRTHFKKVRKHLTPDVAALLEREKAEWKKGGF
jgi:hypothetical protein